VKAGIAALGRKGISLRTRLAGSCDIVLTLASPLHGSGAAGIAVLARNGLGARARLVKAAIAALGRKGIGFADLTAHLLGGQMQQSAHRVRASPLRGSGGAGLAALALNGLGARARLVKAAIAALGRKGIGFADLTAHLLGGQMQQSAHRGRASPLRGSGGAGIAALARNGLGARARLVKAAIAALGRKGSASRISPRICPPARCNSPLIADGPRRFAAREGRASLRSPGTTGLFRRRAQ
jgi:hypothetical protein